MIPLQRYCSNLRLGWSWLVWALLFTGLASGWSAAGAVVVIPDLNLEAAIRSALNKPAGPLNASDLSVLTSLSACSRGITNLSGLEWATNLTSLDLSGNSIIGLAPLGSLDSLVQLSLDGNRINDLSPLARLFNLTGLNVGDNRISSGSVLSALTNLTSLSLYRNPINSLNPLTNLGGLTSLVLYNSGLTDLAPIAGLTNLSYLELRWNPLTNVGAVLAGLTNLSTLYLGGSSISNVSFLQNLTQLTFLNLDHNRIRDLSPLGGLPNLRGLDLGYNPLTNVAQVGAFTNLTSLFLSGNSISNLTMLQTLSQLTSLTLYSNLIGNLSPLTSLTNLSDLGLSWNPVSDYQMLGARSNLTSLWLDGNFISNLSFAQGLTRLNALGLQHNRLSDLAGLGGLTNLIALHADYNRLTNIASLQNLPYLSSAGLIVNLLDLSLGSPAMTTIQSLQSREVNVRYLPQNQPPSISVGTDWIIAANTTSSRTFSVSDDFTRADQLLVTVHSSNTELLPVQSVTVDNAGSLRTLTVTPAFNQIGTALINLIVTDSAGSVAAAGIVVTVQNATNVSIPDPNLEAVLRQVLRKPSGDLNSVDLLALTELYVGDPAITSLSGLDRAVNLTNLFLVGTSVTDLGALQNLTLLKSLTLYDNPIDYSDLAGLTNLTALSLAGNSISDLAFLQNLVQLTYLRLSETAVTDASPVAGLTNLTDLYLASLSISNLTFLQNLSQLTSLSLVDARLTDISQIAVLTNLSYLDLQQNRLTEINSLTNLLNLLDLDLRVNLLQTSNNAVLEFLQNQGAFVLYLPQNRPPAISVSTNWTIALNDTSSLAFSISDDVASSEQLLVMASSGNTGLIPNENISLEGTNQNRTLSVTPAPDQTGTATIFLTVTDDTGFNTNVLVLVNVVVPQLVVIADPSLEAAIRFVLGKPTGALNDVDLLSLTELYVDDPATTNLSGLEGAANLTTLHLPGTSVTNLDVLQNLSRLTFLSFINSRLTDASPLAALTNLVFLDLQGNRLTDVGPLTNLVKLSTLDLRLNLLETTTNPALEYFQAKRVTVLSQPQREPPVFVTPDRWFVAANTTSYVRFSASDGGPPNESLTITARSSDGSLMPNANLILNPDHDEQANDWILTVIPPANYTGASTITLIAANQVSMSATTAVELIIAMPLPLDDQVLEGANLTWLTGGAAPWFGQTNISHDGVSAAQSGSILDDEQSWLEATVTGPGILSFWWKVSSESEYDWLEFYVNNVLTGTPVSGDKDWEKRTVTIPTGTQTIGWRYLKDGDWSLGLDAAWLDQVIFKSTALMTLGALNPVYDGTAQPATASTTPSELTVDLTYNGSASAPTNAGGYEVIGTVNDPNYAGTATNTLTIARATLTATAENKSRAYRQANPLFTVSYAGFVGGDDAFDLNSLPTASTKARITSPAGNYIISLTGGADNNYSFNLVNGTLTITNVVPTLLITAINLTNGVAVITWSASVGYNYRLQYKAEPTDANWVDLSPGVLATGPTATGTNVVGDLPHRFYRVMLVP